MSFEPGVIRCCFMHGENCEPSELCCTDCPEQHHGTHKHPPARHLYAAHEDGSPCVRVPAGSCDECGCPATRSVQSFAFCDQCGPGAPTRERERMRQEAVHVLQSLLGHAQAERVGLVNALRLADQMAASLAAFCADEVGLTAVLDACERYKTVRGEQKDGPALITEGVTDGCDGAPS